MLSIGRVHGFGRRTKDGSSQRPAALMIATFLDPIQGWLQIFSDMQETSQRVAWFAISFSGDSRFQRLCSSESGACLKRTRCQLLSTCPVLEILYVSNQNNNTLISCQISYHLFSSLFRDMFTANAVFHQPTVDLFSSPISTGIRNSQCYFK